MYDDTDFGYGYDDVAGSAYDTSQSWGSSADDAWVSGDMGAYGAYDGQSDAWNSYGQDMDYVAQDPTDSSAWSSAWGDATEASNDAWTASVDAYIEGDYELSQQMSDASYAAQSTADATWDAWGAATYESANSGYDWGSAYGGSDSASMISDNNATSVL